MLKSIMRHWRRIRVGDKWLGVVFKMFIAGGMIFFFFRDIMFSIIGAALYPVFLYVTGWIDYKYQLSKYELEADYEDYNPIVDLIEKRLKEDMK